MPSAGEYPLEQRQQQQQPLHPPSNPPPPPPPTPSAQKSQCGPRVAVCFHLLSATIYLAAACTLLFLSWHAPPAPQTPEAIPPPIPPSSRATLGGPHERYILSALLFLLALTGILALSAPAPSSTQRLSTPRPYRCVALLAPTARVLHRATAIVLLAALGLALAAAAADLSRGRQRSVRAALAATYASAAVAQTDGVASPAGVVAVCALERAVGCRGLDSSDCAGCATIAVGRPLLQATRLKAGRVRTESGRSGCGVAAHCIDCSAFQAAVTEGGGGRPNRESRGCYPTAVGELRMRAVVRAGVAAGLLVLVLIDFLLACCIPTHVRARKDAEETEIAWWH